MSALTPASEVILRHCDELLGRRILFAGDLQDSLPTQFEALDVHAHTQQYHHWQLLQQAMQQRAQFGLTISKQTIAACDTLIYYWPKSKQEAQFQLADILSQLPLQSEIFIVGENRCGVRSAETLLQGYVPLTKIDSARRCGLYYGRLVQQTKFSLSDWWHSYPVAELQINTLPGVFSRDALDVGSALLLSTLQPGLKGKILDVGCGSGVIGTVLASQSPKVKLTLSDVNAAALASSEATLAANNLQGEVLTSNVYSNITGYFDMIVSNPPFHDGLTTSLSAAQTLIRGAVKHLTIGGELRLVANAFLPYPDILDATFGNHEVLAQNGRFKVYKARRSSGR
ncbi:16S rRNA (guanine(1207)-N(2))-methyltransferase RsmC [Serratia microhaemolytica]|uniref:16S rRNA (guanine(1207)-N(2))-methyltransferase RsmC n=1 Tax=Serratia microhaemolytica TaxID=2675110 RepID=UPI000FDD0E55|nr:16S rRNA (guanine(1207)-N(2))-methyltransferase RsmC [Serratia microhaemolytica]